MEATGKTRHSMLDIIAAIDDSLIQQACQSNQAQRLQAPQGSRPTSRFPGRAAAAGDKREAGCVHVHADRRRRLRDFH